MKYTLAFEKTLEMGISNNCYTIARELQREGITRSRIHTKNGASDFTGWGNHCVNMDILADGSYVAIDYTTFSNIDHQQGNFELLSIKASSYESLQDSMNKLYGGDWNEPTLEESEYL